MEPRTTSVFENWFNQCGVDLHKFCSVLQFLECIGYEMCSEQEAYVKHKIRDAVSSKTFDFKKHFFYRTSQFIEKLFDSKEKKVEFFISVLSADEYTVFQAWLERENTLKHLLCVLGFFRWLDIPSSMQIDTTFQQLIKTQIRSIVLSNFGNADFFDFSEMQILSQELKTVLGGKEEMQTFWDTLFMNTAVM